MRSTVRTRRWRKVEPMATCRKWKACVGVRVRRKGGGQATLWREDSLHVRRRQQQRPPYHTWSRLLIPRTPITQPSPAHPPHPTITTSITHHEAYHLPSLPPQPSPTIPWSVGISPLCTARAAPSRPASIRSARCGRAREWRARAAHTGGSR
jgi:hypothetical protein